MWAQKKPDVKCTDSTSDRAKGRLGSGLRVKSDTSGAQDLVIDGSVEGLIQLNEGTLTVGPTAKLMADVSARDVGVCGYVKGECICEGPNRDQEGWLGDWKFDDGTDHDRRWRVFQRLDRNRQRPGEGR
jgi:hypothetical protein